ncbi:MAG: OmpW family outer membrane protein [Bacteroidota bacterium]
MKTLFTALFFLVFGLSTINAQNNDYSKMTLTLSGLSVMPDESDDIEGKNLKISNEYGFEIGLSYFFTKNLATEFSLAYSKHEAVLQYNGIEYNSRGYYYIGDITIIPVNLNLQYHFYVNKFRPYLGAGFNYTAFPVSQDYYLIGGVSGGEIDDTFGFVLQGGINYDINKKWFLNFDIKKLFLSTDLTYHRGYCPSYEELKAKSIVAVPCPDYIVEDIIEEIEIDPLSIGFGVGYKFDW